MIIVYVFGVIGIIVAIWAAFYFLKLAKKKDKPDLVVAHKDYSLNISDSSESQYEVHIPKTRGFGTDLKLIGGENI